MAARDDLNQSLEKAGRVADFFELAELMCIDALRAQRILRRPLSARSIRPKMAKRSATTSTSAMSPPGAIHGSGNAPELVKEPLEFHYVHPSQRSYK